MKKPREALALELLVEDLALLTLRVESMEVFMKQQSLWVTTMTSTLKNIISNASSEKPEPTSSGDMI